MFYQIQGDISFQISPRYYHVLEYWLDKHSLENIVFLFPKNVRFNGGLLELDELKDILSFINQFATISHAELLASRRSNDIISFQLHDGVICEFPYIYHTERHVQKPLALFIQTIQEKNFSIHIEKTEFSNDELDAFEAAILSIKRREKDDFTTELSILAELVQKRGFIEILTEQQMIRWDDANGKCVDVSPFTISEKPQEVSADTRNLSTYRYDEKEQRIFTWNGFTFPLHSIFLGDSNQKSVTLPSGETTTPCSQCVFRLRQLTSSCYPCVPRLLP